MSKSKKSDLFDKQCSTYQAPETRYSRFCRGRGPNLILALLMATVYNLPFWQQLLGLNDFSPSGHLLFLSALLIIMTGVFFFFLNLAAYPYLQKGLALFLILIMGSILYFSLKYGIIIDHNMISNILETDSQEAMELISLSLLGHLLIFVVLPGIIIVRWPRRWLPPLRQTGGNLLVAILTLTVIGTSLFTAYSDFVLIGRSHRYLRLYLNPSYALYSVEKYFRINRIVKKAPTKIALDASRPESEITATRKILGIMVVGESARAANFSLNGYQRETNPKLTKENVISFSQFYACGTSTAEALPGMFSHLKQSDYSAKKAAGYENVLDVLQRLGIEILWRDNNSSAKGVAERVPYEKLRVDQLPPEQKTSLYRNGEIFDMALLVGLQAYINTRPNRDFLIILHQKGSHGPAYHKRRPPDFARFQPEYTGDAVQNASREELTNAYDNTILYTDYFLSQVIAFLRRNADKFDTFMLYMSDHGESLGENGIYLHSLPMFMAPDEQKHIGAIVWFADSFIARQGIDMKILRATKGQPLHHDSTFHTLLGLFKIDSKDYRSDHDYLVKTRLAVAN